MKYQKIVCPISLLIVESELSTISRKVKIREELPDGYTVSLKDDVINNRGNITYIYYGRESISWKVEQQVEIYEKEVDPFSRADFLLTPTTGGKP